MISPKRNNAIALLNRRLKVLNAFENGIFPKKKKEKDTQVF